MTYELNNYNIKTLKLIQITVRSDQRKFIFEVNTLKYILKHPKRNFTQINFIVFS